MCYTISMLKIYNSHKIDRTKRFLWCIALGLPSAMGLGIVYGIFVALFGIQLSVLYIGIGYVLGKLVLNVGHGVHTRYSVLAAVLAAFAFIFGDMLTFNGGWILLMPQTWGAGILFILRYWFRPQTLTNMSALLGLCFRLFGVYEAYINARVVF